MTGVRRPLYAVVCAAAALGFAVPLLTPASASAQSLDSAPALAAEAALVPEPSRAANTSYATEASSAQAAPKPEPNPIRFSLEKHPTLTLPFGEIRFQARLESTVRSASEEQGLDTDLAWQSRHLHVEGTLFKKLEFEVSREFGDADEPEHDTYANYRFARRFELRAGQFKLPFGRDELTGGSHLDFVYRSLIAREVAPGRDIGIEAHGRVFKRRLSYQAGYFLHDGDNSNTPSTRAGEDAWAGRLIVAPFAAHNKSVWAPLQFGVAGVTSRLDNQLGLRGRTVFKDGTFFDRVYVNGRRLRTGLEAAYARGPFSVSAERSDVTDDRDGLGLTGEALPKVHAGGWYVAGTWTLTGETKDGRVEPRSSLFDGGLGAIQLAARVERLSFDAGDDQTAAAILNGTLPGNTDRVTTLGVSWFLNRHFRLQGNAVVEHIEDPIRSPAPNSTGRLPRGVFQFQFVL
jgi:phosphate-selective porin OprO/OprP